MTSKERYLVPDNSSSQCSNKKSINVAATQTMMERAISQSEPLYYTQTETRYFVFSIILSNIDNNIFLLYYYDLMLVRLLILRTVSSSIVKEWVKR